jgi:hypothetical protein
MFTDEDLEPVQILVERKNPFDINPSKLPFVKVRNMQSFENIQVRFCYIQNDNKCYGNILTSVYRDVDQDINTINLNDFIDDIAYEYICDDVNISKSLRVFVAGCRKLDDTSSTSELQYSFNVTVEQLRDYTAPPPLK